MAVEEKIGVVERDAKERDERRLLNLGHTLAHALETALGYQNLRHGEAVAYGMLFAARLAAARGGDPEVERRLCALLSRLELPGLPAAEPDRLIALMRRDKKATEGGLAWVLPMGLGHPRIERGLSETEVRTELTRFLAAPLRVRG